MNGWKITKSGIVCKHPWRYELEFSQLIPGRNGRTIEMHMAEKEWCSLLEFCRVAERGRRVFKERHPRLYAKALKQVGLTEETLPLALHRGLLRALQHQSRLILNSVVDERLHPQDESQEFRVMNGVELVEESNRVRQELQALTEATLT